MNTLLGWRSALLGLIFACLAQQLPAVIVEIREYHGKQVTCVHSGLMGAATSCGTKGYQRVFTGIVTSSVEVGDTDKRLEIIPDEPFTGDSDYVVAITNQACLRTEINVGDKWLFYLSPAPNGDGLVLLYDSPSKPISDAGDDISMLRDLRHLGNNGILIGTIESLDETESTAPDGPVTRKFVGYLANHKVVAKSIATGAEFTTNTNEKGYFKFELPVGKYDVTTAPEYGLRQVKDFGSMDGNVPVQKGECWEHDFGVKPDTGPAPQTGQAAASH